MTRLPVLLVLSVLGLVVLLLAGRVLSSDCEAQPTVTVRPYDPLP